MADVYTAGKRTEIMSRIRGRDTRPARTVRSVLHAMGFRYRLCAPDLPGRPDLVLRRLWTVVFVHGCYWHGHECPKGRSKPKTNIQFWSKKIADNIARDEKTTAELRSRGWRVLVVWECETKDIERLKCLLTRVFCV